MPNLATAGVAAASAVLLVRFRINSTWLVLGGLNYPCDYVPSACDITSVAASQPLELDLAAPQVPGCGPPENMVRFPD